MTCEKCKARPVEVTPEADGFSLAMLRDGRLVCGPCRTATPPPYWQGQQHTTPIEEKT